MKFKYNSWLMLVICAACNTHFCGAFGGCLDSITDQKAGGVKAGSYCENNTKCPSGCYCTGKVNSDFNFDKWRRAFYIDGSVGAENRYFTMQDKFKAICSMKTGFANKEEASELKNVAKDSSIITHLVGTVTGKGYDFVKKMSNSEREELVLRVLRAVGVNLCPSQYPESDAGAKSAEDCYAKISNGGSAYTKLYNKNTKCNAGQYLPRNSNSCTACKTGSRYYCPGGTFHTSTAHDMGLKVKCDAGQYLPKNSSSCTACKTSNRYYVCAGGTFTTYSSSDLGIKKCTGGLVANSDRTACEDANGNTVNAPSSASAIHVPEGQYLPANATEPVPCTGTTKYCPGGEFEKASVEQGRYDCPLNGRANSDKTACVVSVSKTWMQYGPLGTNTPYKRQCWHQADALDPEKYTSCVLSGKYDR